MCEKFVEENSWLLEFGPDGYKTQEMCNKAILEDPWSLIFVPDRFVMLHEMWYEDYSRGVIPKLWYYDDEIIEWYNCYKKRKAQKVQIK